jgi:antitoxin (DNA-binding transcriptional repressor) of toxin-antitoxin stability system
MTTLSPTQARINLSSLLKRAAKGEDIGILHGDQVIALRPVKIHSDDGYALREYMMTAQELARFTKRMDQEIAREYKAGTVKRYSGDLEADIAD